MPREAAKSPNFWDAATARHNILDKYRSDQIKGTDFDPDSIMLYHFDGALIVQAQARGEIGQLEARQEAERQLHEAAKTVTRASGR